MGLLQTITDWQDALYQRRIAKMESKGLCPDCRGKGYSLHINEYHYAPPEKCSGCEGNGSFTTWHEKSQQP
ncbi:methionine aminopeptidase [Bacillus sp. FJAT-44742]|uniref:methionine aminopeptidase n=1 Tax=Bacillus sp. FJAT-44742 TaxID=2014005 RepID=UPI000C24CD93|nr:methionine aminopeptidase [Bacillus sp. FJAT-44742]